MIISDHCTVDLNISYITHTPSVLQMRDISMHTSVSSVCCIGHILWTLQLSASHRPTKLPHMLPRVTCPPPRPRTVSLFFKDLKHFLPLVSPKRLTGDLSHLIPLQEHFKDCTFQKWSPSLSEWTPCDWLREAPASSKRGWARHRGSLGSVCPLHSLLAAQCSSTNIPTADGTQPLIKPQHKDVTCGQNTSQQSSTLESPLKSSWSRDSSQKAARNRHQRSKINSLLSLYW